MQAFCQMACTKRCPGDSQVMFQGLSWASWGCCRAVSFQSLSYPGENQGLLSINLPFTSVTPGAAVSALPGNWSKCTFSGPSPGLLYQKLQGGGCRNVGFQALWRFWCLSHCQGEDPLFLGAFSPTNFTHTLLADTVLRGGDVSHCRRGDNCSNLLEKI